MPFIMKKTLLLSFILFSGFLFAQEEVVPLVELDDQVSVIQLDSTRALTWKDRREPSLAGFLSYIIPGMGQIYNKQYEKALAVFALTGYTLYRSMNLNEGEDDRHMALGVATYCGVYLYSIIDAVVSAKKINKSIAIQLSKDMSMSLKPDLKLTTVPSMPVTPTVGLKLSVSL